MSGNYTIFHCHSQLSLQDSKTDYKEYIDLCKKNGMKSIAISEHGNVFRWVKKKQYCDSQGVKFILACEVYLTEQLEPKVRDNYHTVLIAKNEQGMHELLSLISMSSDEQHMYYKPRITFDEFLNISDNVISTSACLASPLHNLNEDNKYFSKLCQKYTFLEIQPHDHPEQRAYNMFLYELSKKYNKPLILGTDTHSSNQYKAECREIEKIAKKMAYADEDKFDLTFKTYDDLLKMYANQHGKENMLPYDIYISAIENTNLIDKMTDDIELETSFKYPNIYPDEENYLDKEVEKSYKDKVSLDIINGNNPKYIKNIEEESRVFKKIGQCSFMLSMSDIMRFCKNNNIPTGPARGSVAGSTIAYLLDIIDLDPVQWDTVFSRFANEDRVSLGDIDIDIAPDSRDKVFDYVIHRFGKEKTCRVLTLGTVADKGAIDEIARALIQKEDVSDEIKKKYSIANTKIIKERYTNILTPYIKVYNLIMNKDKKTLDFSRHANYIEDIKSIDYEEKDLEKFNQLYKEYIKLRKDYVELFYYFDGIRNTTVSHGIHAAGIIASPITLADSIGLLYDNGNWVSQLDMEELHDLNFVKYDLLGLKNVQIIYDTYKLANKPYPRSYQVDWNDQEVYKDMITSPIGIFQFEGDYAFSLLKTFEPHKLNDMSLINAALRPGGKSYRNKLIEHEINHNPTKEIDELLKDNYGYLVYQEDVLKFLQKICGLSGSQADLVRRHIADKDFDKLEKDLPKVLDGYCRHSDKPEKEAKEEAKQFIQILIDSASYMFGYNHSTGYSMIGYREAYLRHYEPLEFVCAYLNNAGNNQKDLADGTTLARLKNINIYPPKFRYSKDTYYPDKKTNSIYKGIASIKYCNAEIAEQMYLLRDKHYDTFIDLLVDLTENTSINIKQLNILIMLNFFSEFGGNAKLVKIFNEFTKGKNKYKKTYVEKTKIKRIDLLKDYENSIPDEKVDLKTQIDIENENLGYVQVQFPELPKSYLYILDGKFGKYSPKIEAYCLATGVTKTLKLYKKQFDKNPFDKGTIINISKYQQRRKAICVGKDDKGNPKFEQSNEKEWWITKYNIVNDIDEIINKL
ncbi:DNA polymerase III subunit alpha [Clostridium sp. MT-14]|uniref:DNA polymerase III subunit alpha n=1 Tax=Clostridium sp. MT-14 TaxID=3348360 RepID=UPI0035F31138